MPRTKREAIKEQKRLQKQFPRDKCVILDHRKRFPKKSSMRYNFRFVKRKRKK